MKTNEEHQPKLLSCTISQQTIKIAMDCIYSERNALENLIDGWKPTSSTYKRHEIEIEEYTAAYEELSALLKEIE